jgi:AraC-like DNA-binding protein
VQLKRPPSHRSVVLGTPWKGVYATHIESDRHYGRHSHATYGMGFVERGAHRSASGRGRVDAYAGDVLTCNPGEVHDGQPLGGLSRRWKIVYLEPAALAAAMQEPGAAGISAVEITRPVIQDAILRKSLERLLGRLENWSRAKEPAGTARLACEEALVQSCALLLDRHSTAPLAYEAPGDVRQVRERLADDPLNAPTLAELASIAGLSRYQVLRRFGKAYGLPPHAWLLQQRAERARRLIREGDGLVTAAASAGFADQSHMSRVFQRQFGFTPGAWKTAMGRPAAQ